MDDRTIDNLQVGDYCFFCRSFSKTDFRTFVALSDDNNFLHHEQSYARSADFEECIVPVFMAAGPISAIAGEYLPGHRSLIMKYSLSARAPIFYDDEITYSAKIVGKNLVEETLALSVVVFSESRNSNVVLTGEMLVKVRPKPVEVKKRWLPTRSIKRLERGTVLIIGATSGIGEAIARRFAREGKDLVLVYFSNQGAAKKLQKELTGNNSVWVRKYSVLNKSQFKKISREPWYENLDTIVHTLSSPLDSNLMELMESNYLSLRFVTEASLPTLLQKQAGKIVAIGTGAAINSVEGLEDYVAAKTAAAGYLSSIGKQLGPYGVRTAIVAPDAMKTAFSDELQFDDSRRMLPEQAAEEVLTIGADSFTSGSFSWVTAQKTFRGDFGFAHRQGQAPDQVKDSSTNPNILEKHDEKDKLVAHRSQVSSNPEVLPEIRQIVSSILKQTETDISEFSGVGQTPAWDSLKQVEILLAIERRWGIRFPSSGFNGLLSVQDITKAVATLLNAQSK